MLALFENELRRGTGAPVILLKKNAIYCSELTDSVIIDCILNDYRIENYTEDLRGTYLFTVVSFYARKEKIYTKVTQEFERIRDSSNVSYQIMDFMIQMYKHGLFEKNRVYQKIEELLFLEKDMYVPGFDEIINADGFDAIVFLSRVLGRMILAGKEFSMDITPFFFPVPVDDMYDSCIEIVNKLRQLDDPEINAYLNFIETGENERSPKYNRKSFEEIRQSLLSNNLRTVRMWVKNAADDEIDQLSQLFLEITETNTKRIILNAFDERKIQIDEEYLWKELSRTRSDVYRRSIIESLIPFQNPRLKDVIKKYNSGTVQWASIKAYANFCNEEDLLEVGEILSRCDTYALHYLVTYLCECKNLRERSYYGKILRYLYQHNACSMCRVDIVKELGRINMLDCNLIEELKYDVNGETRRIAGEYDESRQNNQGQDSFSRPYREFQS